MPAFNYIAYDKIGKEQKGTLEGESERHIRQQLRERGLIPLKVASLEAKKTAAQRKLPLSRRRQRVNLADLALLTRQLATLLAAGLPIAEALQGVSEQFEKPQVSNIIRGVRSRVLEGHALANAMAQFPNAFPELYCATVSAGEHTGKLDLVLTRLADYTEQQQTMRQKIQQALIYPTLMILVSVGIVTFLLVFVVPKIIEVFSNTGQSLPAVTQILIAVSFGLKAYGLYLVLALVIAIIALRRALKNKQFQFRYHTLLLKVPLIAYAIKTINTARYARTFGILSAAGVAVLEAMRVSATLITNLPMRDAIASAANRVKEGANISYSLKQTGYFTPMTIYLIASGESSGALEDMLERSADHQDNEVSRLIETGLTLFEPLIILVMGSVVLFIVLSVLVPIFSMEQITG